MRWPFMLRRTHDAVALENYTLRDALREANAELVKHRQLIAGLKTGQTEIMRDFERVINRANT